MYIPGPTNLNLNQAVSMTEYPLQNSPLLFFGLSDRNLKVFAGYNLIFSSLQETYAT